MILVTKGVEMTKGLKIGFIVTGSLIGALLLTAAGFFIAREVNSRTAAGTPAIVSCGFNNPERKGGQALQNEMRGHQQPERGQASPWMNQPGMGYQGQRNNVPQGDQPGRGDPGQANHTPQGNQPSQSISLTIDSAKTTVDAYLARWNNPDLKVAEIILFSNNAYARIMEQSTGTGAMELLVNENGRVSPEMGANMMWNLKYGMMGSLAESGQTATTPMTVTAEQALADVQTWLDANVSGAKAAATADAFYGYYTVEYTVDGKITGMVSVNGFSGVILPHSWHGTFMDIKEY